MPSTTTNNNTRVIGIHFFKTYEIPKVYLRLKRLIDKKEMGSLFKVFFATKKNNNFNLGF